MARYKEYSYDQTKLIPISYDQQIIPGTFEHTLSEVIDSMDMGIFERRYDNDETGAPAYDPRILLKIVLYAYSKGIIFSRRIAQCCCENVIFMALSADSQPHFTTIADFVSTMQEKIISLFRYVCRYAWNLSSSMEHVCNRRNEIAVKCIQGVERYQGGFTEEAGKTGGCITVHG